MKLLVIGREGQVARALAHQSSDDTHVICLGRPDVDVRDMSSVEQAIKLVQPDIVVNAAAYTAVDRAESEPDLAFAINCDGARNLAIAAAAAGTPVIHLSTDYVFSGIKSTPYVETDETGPVSIYGQSKLAGERAIAEAAERHVILRTSWVYAPYGSNFAGTMLRLAETRDVIGVVADQYGAPTYAPDIAQAILVVVRTVLSESDKSSWRGLFHMTSTGETTWAGFAEEIFGASATAGGPSAVVERIATFQYPTAAKRPANSRLDDAKFVRVFGHRLPSWEQGVPRFLAEFRRLTE